MGARLAGEIAAVVLGAIALLHIYWGIVGVPATSAAIPQVDGKPIFRPGLGACFAVAALLVVAVCLLLLRTGRLPSFGPAWLATAGAAAVGAVLVLRAVGDFRYVGFFKSVRGSEFARLDSLYFAPLCLVLGALALWAAFGARSR